MSTAACLGPTCVPTGTPLTEFRGARIHMIGAGGSGMSGLAAVLLRRGARVTGSDQQPSVLVARLIEQGAHVTCAPSAATLPADTQLVVASAAIPETHPELVEARRRGVTVCKYACMLGTLMAQSSGVAVSGTHGKSTTSAWVAYALKRAGFDPSFVIGALCDQVDGGSGVGNGRYFVAEACEYDRSFLNLRPRCAAILNIEEDHLDCYENLAAIVHAFSEFARQVPADGMVALNADDPGCRSLAADVPARVETFGLNPGVTWRAVDVSVDSGYCGFLLEHNGRTVERVRLGVPGRHNVSNALAMIALARECQVPWEVLRPALADFHGVRRRLEERGYAAGVRVVDDYAHHPTEIRATLRTARERYQPRRLWCVFQPHQHSRTRFLLADFARSFGLADHVVVPDIYFVRDSEREREAVRAQDLVERIRAGGGDALHIPDFDAIVEHVAREVAAGDVVITMGAGNIWKAADELVRRLGGNLPV